MANSKTSLRFATRVLSGGLGKPKGLPVQIYRNDTSQRCLGAGTPAKWRKAPQSWLRLSGWGIPD